MERERGRAWEEFWRGERGMENLGVRRWEVDLWLPKEGRIACVGSSDI